MNFSKQEVLEANINLHTNLAKVYKQSEPHYREENIARIDSILKKIQDEVGGKRLLDVGCGMGFIIDIAKKYFERIDGVDITQAMLDKVDLDSTDCKIDLHISEVEKMPFDNDTFDVCTAYAVLHHLFDINEALIEINRVLKKGGVFYSDLDPNYYFWQEFKHLEFNTEYSQFVTREILAVQKKDEEIAQQLNINKKIVLAAESFKHIDGGMREESLKKLFQKTGFSEVTIIYDWFLGEGAYIHDEEKQKDVTAIRYYLLQALPLTRHLFKYIRIIAKK